MEPHTLYLYSYIDQYEARDLAHQLADRPGALTLRLHSPGGEVYSGLAIYNLLQARRAEGHPVVTYIDGMAASMASIIAMAGSRVHMAENAQLMIHNPWAFSQGDGEALRKDAAQLDQVKTQLVDIYTRKTGLEPATIAALMNEERYLPAHEALVLGFVDELVPAVLERQPEANPHADLTGRPAAVYNHYGKAPFSNAMAEIKAGAGQVRQLLAKAEAEISELKATLVHRDAELLVGQALAERRISPVQRESFLALAKADPTATRSALAALPGRQSLTSQLKHSAQPGNDRSRWTMRDWEKQDPKGLQEMQTQHPEAYRVLYAVTYSK